MRRLLSVFALVAFAAVTASSPAPVQADPAAPAPAAVIGSQDKAKWSATTEEAAATEANKKWLTLGKPATLTGEVVDYSCYTQLGKRGEAHVPCGTKCLTNGQPAGLLTPAGKLYVLIAEEHHPRRDGEADLKSIFLPYLAKTVTVSGMLVTRPDSRTLFVSTIGAKTGDAH